jgi:hypothetical protein
MPHVPAAAAATPACVATAPAGGIKKAGDPEHPDKLQFLSFMVMDLLGPSVGHLSLALQTYTTNLQLLVNHGLGMLKVRGRFPSSAKQLTEQGILPCIQQVQSFSEELHAHALLPGQFVLSTCLVNPVNCRPTTGSLPSGVGCRRC